MAAVVEGGPPNQPFQCSVCLSRFTRHENLKRHAALHNRSQGNAALPCEYCSATFSRPDLRHRHMRRKHPEHAGKRTHRHSSTRRPGGGSDGGRSQDDRTSPRSFSSTASHRMSLSRHSADEASEVGSMSWHTPLPYLSSSHRQSQFEHGHGDHYDDTSNLGSSLSTNADADDRLMATGSAATAQPLMALSAGIDHIASGGTEMDHDFFLGAPRFKSSFPFDDQLPPLSIFQSAAFDASSGVFSFTPESPDKMLTAGLATLQEEDWCPSTTQISQGCTLFFSHVAHFLPFLHQATFDVASTPQPLLLAMLSLAYQYGEDPVANNKSGSGAELSKRCFHRARALVAAVEDATDEIANTVTTVQTYLLLQVCAMMYLCSQDSAYGLEIHSKMIALARAGKLMQPVPAEANTTQDLDSLWRAFARAESHKRTSFAVHQIDALWYQFLSIPRAVSHLEVKHDLPCPEDYWSASSSSEWAHRQLVTPTPSTPVQYADAVRRFLAPDADVESIPTFDSYGAINIAQFLFSSAREVSGWSTMAGVFSMERFELLRASLAALRPFMHTRSGGSADGAATPPPTASPHAALCEATWETAMLELQIWSPAHTGGIVEGSMDAVLDQSTHLAPATCGFLCEAETARAVQPHVDWFLRYLDDAAAEPDAEAPWLTLYAYKAFLIAWQLVRGGVAGAMRVVGVGDGDVEGALAWARKVFGRRERWQLGKLTLRCLGSLET